MTKPSMLPETFAIEPFDGAGPIRLGMTADQVRATLGPPVNETRNRRGEIDQSWDCVSVRYGIDQGRVVEVGLIPPAVPTFRGQDLFGAADPISLLCAEDPTPMEYMGFVVFLQLGVTLTGFHDDDDAQKALTVFARGRWDGLRAELRPL